MQNKFFVAADVQIKHVLLLTVAFCYKLQLFVYIINCNILGGSCDKPSSWTEKGILVQQEPIYPVENGVQLTLFCGNGYSAPETVTCNKGEFSDTALSCPGTIMLSSVPWYQRIMWMYILQCTLHTKY